MNKLFAKKIKITIIVIPLILLLMEVFFCVLIHKKRPKAVYTVDNVVPVNEIIKLDYKIPLMEINVSKFHIAKNNAKKTIEKDNSLIDFYKQAYSYFSKYNYDGIKDNEEDIYTNNKVPIKNVDYQYSPQNNISR